MLTIRTMFLQITGNNPKWWRLYWIILTHQGSDIATPRYAPPNPRPHQCQLTAYIPWPIKALTSLTLGMLPQTLDRISANWLRIFLDPSGLWHHYPSVRSPQTLDSISANWLYIPYQSLPRPKVTHVECTHFSVIRTCLKQNMPQTDCTQRSMSAYGLISQIEKISSILSKFNNNCIVITVHKFNKECFIITCVIPICTFLKKSFKNMVRALLYLGQINRNFIFDRIALKWAKYLLCL
jgi:hypothetical protein